MPIANVPSVLAHGILSYDSVAELEHSSIALHDVQEKRERTRIPGGLRLHQYANVYFHARNPMMSRRRTEAQELCVLRVSREILTISGAVVTDQNATSRYVQFGAPEAISSLNLDYIFSRNWKHPNDQIEEWKHSSAKCAEVLIPHSIPSRFLVGALVANQAAKQDLLAAGFDLRVDIDADLFFHSGG